MNISEVKIKFIKPNNGIVAFASFVVDGALCVSGVAIHRRLNGDGYRLTYPMKEGVNSCYPINRDAGRMIEQVILGEYNVIRGLK